MRLLLETLIVFMFISDRVFIFGALGGADFRLWQVFFVLSTLLIVVLKKLKVSSSTLIVILLIYIHLIVVSFFNQSFDVGAFFQVFAFGAAYVALYNIVQYLGVERSVELYFYGAVINSVSVILEEFIYLLAPSVAMSYLGCGNCFENVGFFARARGFLGEPSQAAILIAPAIYFALASKRYVVLCLLVGAIMFTFSTLSFISMLIAIILYKRWKPSIAPRTIAFTVFIAGIIISLSQLGPVADRVEQLGAAYEAVSRASLSVDDFMILRGSVATLLMNSLVAYHSLIDTYIGAGFSRFYSAYTEYSVFYADTGNVEGLFYNQQGGGSLAIRIVAEFGVLSLFFLGGVGYSIVKFFRLPESVIKVNKYSAAGVGVGLTILVAYFIRKDMYLNVYLLYSIALISHGLGCMNKNYIRGSGNG